MISSLLLCFGAGILMATSLLHILPESREGMLKEQESLEIECLAELVLCSGFFLVYFLECLIHEVVGHSSSNSLAKFHSHESHDSVEEMVGSSSNHTSSNSSTSWIRNIVTGEISNQKMCQSTFSLLQPLLLPLTVCLRDLLWALRRAPQAFGLFSLVSD